MSKNRYINTKIWSDNYYINLDPIEKLLFMYILTNEKTNICGIYEIPLKIMAVETGIDRDMIEKIFKRFEADNKIKYNNGWVAIRNFIKHQKISDNPNDKINIGIKTSLENSPIELVEWIKQDPLRGLKNEIDPLNYLNLNLNLNLNTNSNINSNSDNEKTDDKSSELENQIDELYTLYPSRDKNNNNRSTSKKLKDKDKIRALIKSISYDILKQTFDYYLADYFNKKQWISNLSVFLNNLPDINEFKKPVVNEIKDISVDYDKTDYSIYKDR